MTIDPTLKDAWKSAAVEACAALRGVPDTDPAVRLRVARNPDGVAVEALLADGRRAVRQVAAPGDLRLTLEALAVKPPPEKPPPPEAPAPSANGQAIPPPPSPPPLEVQAGLWLSGRASGLPVYLSVGPTLAVDLTLGPWLVGLLARWEAYQAPASTRLVDFAMQTAGAGLFGGRRILERAGARVDLGLQLAVLAQTQSFTLVFQDDEEEDEGSSSIPRGGSEIDARLGLFARATIGASALRWLVALDAELSPFQIGGGVHADAMAPALPGWSASVSTGIAFGTALPWSAP